MVAFALMTAKTEELYFAVIEHVKARAGNNFLVETLISDYEMAIIQSMATAFPTARTQGCYFHYSHVCYIFLWILEPHSNDDFPLSGNIQ